MSILCFIQCLLFSKARHAEGNWGYFHIEHYQDVTDITSPSLVFRINAVRLDDPRRDGNLRPPRRHGPLIMCPIHSRSQGLEVTTAHSGSVLNQNFNAGTALKHKRLLTTLVWATPTL